MKRPGFLKTHSWDHRNQYFRFHPMQNSFALLAALVLLGLLTWFMVWMPSFR